MQILSGSAIYHVIPNRLQLLLKCPNAKGIHGHGSNGTFHTSLVGMNTDKITMEGNFVVSITT